MEKLTSRERVRLALNLQETDRIPIDFGGRISGIALGAYVEVKNQLGIKTETVIDDKRLQLAKVEPEIIEMFQVDTSYIYPNAARTWNPQENINEFTDEWGVRLKMPEGGFYYDYVDFPIKAPTFEAIEKHRWPDTGDLSRVQGKAEEASYLYNNTTYALVTTFRGTFEQCWPLRGLENFLVDMLLYPDFAQCLLDKVLTIQKKIYGSFLEAVGPFLDLVCFTDDLGTQIAPMLSPELYRRLIKPRHREMVQFIRNKTQAKIAIHSCGSVAAFIDDFIDLGIEVLNPVQATATGMDTKELKIKYGQKLAFWGSIDTQRVLPFKRPEDVVYEVNTRIKDLGTGGGFLLAPCHDIQANTPAQNIITLFKTAAQKK